MISSVAITEIKMLDWIVFALQYAFESVLFSSLIILVTLALILGLLGRLWGWLWNRKWSPFHKLSDMFVCVLIALLFSLTSLALHGLSGQNFGMGTKEITYANYNVPRNGKISNTLFRVSTDSQNQETISKTPELSSRDGEQVRQHVTSVVTKRWAESQQGDCPKVIRDFLNSALKQDQDLTEVCEGYAKIDPKSKNKDNALKESRKDFDTWEKAFNNHAVTVVDSYGEAVSCLIALWYVLMLLMLIYVVWRAYTDIKLCKLSVGCTPSEKALEWAQNAGTEEAHQEQE